VAGTVLLVEDEDQVKLVAKAMLKTLGFKVIEVSNGREALDLYQNNSADITLVLTDIGMPVMDGYTLFRELKALNSELPIIISSGFGDSVVTTRIPVEEIAGLVSKPYRFDQLRDVLKGVVEGVK
jgi:CheY-like chemotaxis protein